MKTPTPWSMRDILKASGGNLVCGEAAGSFDGISIDSRVIGKDELFIAVSGDTHDGHRFVKNVLDQGGRGFIVQENRTASLPLDEMKQKRAGCVVVKNSTRALGDLAAFHRRRSSVTVVAITGSNGKTTTREMATSVVQQRYETLTSPKNYNNEIGLPLSLLQLEPSHEMAILELGMNHPGEIAYLTKICNPDVGVITNIGPVHLEGVGSLDGVMQAKKELLDHMTNSGTAVLNGDDQRLRKLATLADQRVVLFGHAADASIRAEAITETEQGLSFTLALPAESRTVHLAVPGRFMVSNALAAATVGHLLGLPGEAIRTGLERFRPVDGRMHIKEITGGITVINDTYNANPVSVKAAIETFIALKGDNRGILILGDMLELGPDAESMHKEMGSISAQSGSARLYATGDFSNAVATGAMENGLATNKIFTGTKDEICNDLLNCLEPDDWVLVKGSRGMAMETIVHWLQNRESK